LEENVNEKEPAQDFVCVIPEDLPELEEDSALNDPELREQLK